MAVANEFPGAIAEQGLEPLFRTISGTVVEYDYFYALHDGAQLHVVDVLLHFGELSVQPQRSCRCRGDVDAPQRVTETSQTGVDIGFYLALHEARYESLLNVSNMC